MQPRIHSPDQSSPAYALPWPQVRQDNSSNAMMMMTSAMNPNFMQHTRVRSQGDDLHINRRMLQQNLDKIAKASESHKLSSSQVMKPSISAASSPLIWPANRPRAEIMTTFSAPYTYFPTRAINPGQISPGDYQISHADSPARSTVDRQLNFTDYENHTTRNSPAARVGNASGGLSNQKRLVNINKIQDQSSDGMRHDNMNIGTWQSKNWMEINSTLR